MSNYTVFLVDKYSRVVDLRTGHLYEFFPEKDDGPEKYSMYFEDYEEAREFAKAMIDRYPHRFGVMVFEGKEIEYFSIDALPPVDNPVTEYIKRESFWGYIKRKLKFF